MSEAFPQPENSAEKNPVKKYIDKVFANYPELAAIGTPERYSEYLDTIFPNSVFKEIFLHGTSSQEEFEATDWTIGEASAANLGKGYYFAPNADKAERYTHNNGRIIYTVLDIQNPVYTNIVRNDNKGKKYAGSIPTSELVGEGKDAVIHITYADSEFFTPYNQYMDVYTGPLDTQGFPSRQPDYMRVPEMGELAVVSNSQIHILGSKADMQKFKTFTEQEKTPLN